MNGSARSIASGDTCGGSGMPISSAKSFTFSYDATETVEKTAAAGTWSGVAASSART